jgi:hypothetical protein
MSSNKVVVSISKLVEFLSKKSYIIITVYVVRSASGGDSIRFVEARTPKYQKSFMIYVSQKYKMVPGNSHPIKSINIVPRDPGPMGQGETTRQSEYLNRLKGSFVDCDLTSVSSRYICIYRNNGTSEIYSIGDGDHEEKETTTAGSGCGNLSSTKETPTQKVIKDATLVFESLDETLTLPEEEDPPESIILEEEDADPDESIAADPGEEEVPLEENDVPIADDTTSIPSEVELQFEDAEGESVADVAEFIESPPEIVLEKNKETTKNIPGDQSESINLSFQMEDEDIILGIVYHTIDLLIFYKSVNVLEEKISSIYDVIEDNENSMREDRVSNIEEMAENLVIKIRASHERFIAEEGEMKTQLSQLSSIFDQTANLKDKVKSDTKYIDSKVEIERVYFTTRNTIRDLNIELLRLRDAFDELLDNTHTGLDEMIK